MRSLGDFGFLPGVHQQLGADAHAVCKQCWQRCSLVDHDEAADNVNLLLQLLHLLYILFLLYVSNFACASM
jgi:hypothetical protein